MAASLATLALLGAFAGLTVWRSRSRARAIEAAWPPEGEFVTIGGVRMHAVMRGTGPDIVLIHGLSGSARDFTFDLAAILARSYRVIAIDRPGMGWSDPVIDGHTLATQAQIVRQAAFVLGAERPLVLGVSYGGSVALRWALDAPDTVAALVLAAPVSHPWKGGLSLFYHLTSTPLLKQLAIPLLAAWVPGAAVRKVVAEVFAPDPVPPGYMRHLGPEMTIRPASLNANGVQRRALRAEIEGQWSRYGEISCPVEIVHGTADTTVGLPIHSERLAKDVAGARLTRLDGTGHMPHHARIDDVLAAVARAAARAAG